MTSIPTAVDLVVIGGGINGCGIARDAAGRGLSVLLCERDDLAAHTSSASTKLIHGGMRYLEYYEFRLVRKALQEREVLLRAAPHIIWPLRFVMPHDPSMRPEWMIRCGLFLYDHLARRELLAGSEVVTLANHPAGAVLADGFTRGYVYSDGWVDDARLVALCALDAFERGATVLTQTECVGARRSAEHWDIDLRRRGQDQVHSVRARAVINAAGPWVAQVLAGALQTPSDHHIRLVKGSHIIVPKLFDHAYAYIFQNPDKRIIFAIPYQQDFTLIGTTDIEYRGDPGTLRIDQEEVDYLCAMASRYFRRAVTAGDVVHTYSGVRPLLEDDASDASAVTRDYWLELNSDAAPVVSVFGGKITTFRRLSEEAMDLLLPVLGTSSKQLPDWTAHSALPGGDMVDADFSRFLAGVEVRYPWLPAPLRLRYARAYGTRMDRWLNRMTSMAELGDPVAPGVYAPELTYLRDIEWARTGQDVLWRRSKLGLHLTAPQRQAVTEWMATHPAPTHAAGSVPASMQQEIG